MGRLLAIAQTGLASLQLHPLRSVVTTGAVTVLLVPYLAGLAISQGIEAEAVASVRFGADLYVTGEEFGRTVPIPLTAVNAIRQLDGVTRVVPRIVGSLTLGKEGEPAVVVGLPESAFPADVRCVTGRLPRPGKPNELVIGTELARRLQKLTVGDRIPPFYFNPQGEGVSLIVGVFEADAPLWQARLVLTPFDTAAHLFNASGQATDLLVYCRPGYGDQVRATIRRNLTPGQVRAKVTSRADLEALLPRDLLHREGIFNLHFVLAFAVGILVVLVTSGVGLTERRREVGILKATGWQTDEVLLRGLVESFLLSLAGASLALVLAWAWLKGLNGYGIAGVFLTGADLSPAFAVPCRIAPVPALLAFVLSFAVVMSGTLVSTWRAATATPLEAMRWMDAMPLLEARALCKVYRQGARAEVRAVDGVSLAIAAGSFVAATGPSGSGKTTLLALLGALDRPTSGEVWFDGRNVAALSDAERTRVRRRMGFIFQSFSLIARLPAWENVTYPLIPRGVPRAERQRRADELLTRLGLGDRRLARPEELSGGEQQRVAVARALAGHPDVLIADEPTSNLDPHTADVVAALLREQHGRGATVLVASHDPRIIEAATVVHPLAAGRLLPQAT